jgi:Tol biopolymer transport system component
MPYRVVGLAATVLVLALVVGASIARPGSSSSAGGRIAFTSGTDNGWRLFVMNADGSGVQPITDDTAFDFDPAWSPAESKVAFYSKGRGGPGGLYTVNVDGTGLEPLGEMSDRQPSWSPDGQRIAFSWASSDIYVMNADGSNRVQLTQDPSPEFEPAWSPDGTKIAFVRAVSSDFSVLYVMESDGRLPRPLVSVPFTAEEPAWSPDSAHVVFVGHPHPPVQTRPERPGSGPPPPPPPPPPVPGEIYSANADGTNVVRLTDNTFDDRAPAWSPDGQRIAFASTRDGNYELYSMRFDGSDVVRLTFDSAHGDSSPTWEPLVPPPPAPPPPPVPPPPPSPPAPPPPPPPPPVPPRRSCVVPRVIGLRLATARRKVQHAHCRVGHVYRAHSRRSRVGRVIRQSPSPGAVRSTGWRVSVVIGRR